MIFSLFLLKHHTCKVYVKAPFLSSTLHGGWQGAWTCTLNRAGWDRMQGCIVLCRWSSYQTWKEQSMCKWMQSQVNATISFTINTRKYIKQLPFLYSRDNILQYPAPKIIFKKPKMSQFRNISTAFGLCSYPPGTLPNAPSSKIFVLSVTSVLLLIIW